MLALDTPRGAPPSNEASLRAQNAELRRLLDQAEDKIAELEEQLGLIGDHGAALARLGLSEMQARLARVLLRRDFCNRQQLGFALYYDRPDVDTATRSNTLNAHLSHLRGRLRRIGVTFETVGFSGWRMPPEQKAKLKALIEAVDSNARPESWVGPADEGWPSPPGRRDSGRALARSADK